MPDQPEPTAPDSPASDRDAPQWFLPALAIASLGDDVPERRMQACPSPEVHPAEVVTVTDVELTARRGSIKLGFTAGRHDTVKASRPR
jgi:hypothetical protein